MPQNNDINPNHANVRGILRVVGPLFMLCGGACMLIAGIDFFSVMAGGFSGRISNGPTLFWLFFVGIPLLAVGGMISQFAFLGAVARYTAQESAPVLSDTINYLGKSSAPGITSATRAMVQGLSSKTHTCPACATPNDSDARFCDNCGAMMTITNDCPACNKQNSPDAKFCDNCGTPLANS